jgi:hypothetical protein
MKNRLRILSLAVVALTSASIASPSERGQVDHFTKKELMSLTATASTPEEHRKLAVYYEQEVQRETAEAQKAEQELRAEQANSARQSTKQPNGRLDYFKYEVAHHRKAAEKAQALAAVHDEKAGMDPSAAVNSVAQSSKSTENCCSMSCCRSGSC